MSLFAGNSESGRDAAQPPMAAAYSSMSALMVASTTTGSKEQAMKLARGAVEKRLAACAQIDGPITSVYMWKGAVEENQEFRITFKVPAIKEARLQTWVRENHPFETLEWVVVSADRVGPAYLKWARESCSD